MGQPGVKPTDAFSELLHLDTLRGDDSAGVARAYFPEINSSDIKCEVMWNLGSGLRMWGSKQYNKSVTDALQVPKNFLLMGHNRAATKGAVNLKNAHPFVHGATVMSHNGTLTSYKEFEDLIPKCKKGKPQENFDTDSEHVCYAIHKKGIEWVWERLNGAACLTWWDADKATFNMVRNKERPMYFLFTKDQDRMFYASERWMLDAVTSRGRHAPRFKDVQEVQELKEHYWYTFRWNTKKNKVTFQEKKLKHRPAPVVSPSVSSFRSIGSSEVNTYGQWRFPQSPLRGSFSALTTKEAGYDDTTTPEHPAWEDVRYKHITEAEFLRRYPNCYFCGADLKDEYNTSVIVDEYMAACDLCAEGAEACGINLQGMKGA